MYTFNNKSKCFEFESEPYKTGRHWFFNNGQFAEKTFIHEQKHFQLSYHYNRVYVMSHITNDCGGAIMQSCMYPLSKVQNSTTLDICKELFLKDKSKNVIAENYQFV